MTTLEAQCVFDIVTDFREMFDVKSEGMIDPEDMVEPHAYLEDIDQLAVDGLCIKDMTFENLSKVRLYTLEKILKYIKFLAIRYFCIEYEDDEDEDSSEKICDMVDVALDFIRTVKIENEDNNIHDLARTSRILKLENDALKERLAHMAELLKNINKC
jgi:hypothetical protein